jgi:hypothetical protein
MGLRRGPDVDAQSTQARQGKESLAGVHSPHANGVGAQETALTLQPCTSSRGGGGRRQGTKEPSRARGAYRVDADRCDEGLLARE